MNYRIRSYLIALLLHVCFRSFVFSLSFSLFPHFCAFFVFFWRLFLALFSSLFLIIQKLNSTQQYFSIFNSCIPVFFLWHKHKDEKNKNKIICVLEKFVITNKKNYYKYLFLFFFGKLFSINFYFLILFCLRHFSITFLYIFLYLFFKIFIDSWK